MKECWLWPSSRGDRVRTRLALPRGPGPHPLVLYLPADGNAAGADASQAVARFGSFAAVACIDLPLCGSRHSEKLSQRVFDPADVLHRRLSPDAERQLVGDVDVVLERLRELPELDTGRVAVAARGLGAALAGDRPQRDARFRASISCGGAPSPGWLDRAVDELRDALR